MLVSEGGVARVVCGATNHLVFKLPSGVNTSLRFQRFWRDKKGRKTMVFGMEGVRKDLSMLVLT